MADFSLRDAWWLQPKGPDNPLPALELGVRMSQFKSSMLLKKGELANDIARTEIARQEMESKQKIQTMIMEGNAAQAAAIAGVTDWNDDEQVARIWAEGARYPTTVGNKAWLGAQHMRESARKAKIAQENAQSMIERRAAQTELATIDQERKKLLADASIELTDRRIVDLDDRRDLNLQKQALAQKKYELDLMLGGSEMEYDDAKIQKMRQDINMGERRMLIMEGNLALRAQELSQKGRRLDAREQASYDSKLKALNEEEKGKLSSVSASGEEADRLRKLYGIKRNALIEKFYGPASTNAPPDVPAPATTAHDPRVPRAGLAAPGTPAFPAPAPIAPASTNAPADTNIRRQGGNLFQQQPDGTWKFIGPAQ